MGENNQQEKLSYEQLQGLAHQLSEQVRKMSAQIRDMNLSNVIARIDLLFKVIGNKEVFSKDFVKMCINEIEELMTIPEEPVKETDETETE